MMFLRRYIAVFLGLCDSVRKGRHKATTPNGVPQGEGHTVLFLCLFNLASKNCHNATTPNGVPQEKTACDGAICKLVLYLVYYLV